ncbi:hypothetical protein Tco_1427285, partial [Tanacetum coccineum]
ASKFLKFSNIPQPDAEIVSPLDVYVHHEVSRTQASTLLTIPVSVITESSLVYTKIPQSSQTFTPLPIPTTPTPPPTIETTNPLSTLPDFALVFRFNDRITTLEKEVVELKKPSAHSLKDQLLQILPKEVSNFAPPVIEELIKVSREEVTLAKVSSQPHSTYEAASTLTKFELKKILLDKIEKSESYLAAPEHRDCYDSLKKSYDLEKDFFFSYDVYSLKRSRKDKDKDEDPSAGSDRGLKKRKPSKDADPTTGPKKKDSTSGSSKDQEENMGDNEDEPRKETASRRDWFKKPTPPQEPTNCDWHDFDELMSTLIDFSSYILNGLKIENLTQEILLGPAFRLLKGTCSNYPELEYDFEECYKALSKKLDWENLEGGDYPFDLSKPLPLITRGKHQRVPFEYFMNNDLKYLQGGVLTMTYMTSTTKTKAAQYDLPGIEDKVPNIWSLVKVAYDKCALWGISHWREQRKSFYVYARGIQSRGDVYSTKRILAVTHVKNRLTNLSGDDVADFAIALRMFTRSLVIQKLMRSDELYKFSDGMLTRILSSLEDITKNIDMEYLPKRRWSTLEKKRAHFMIKEINKLLKERRMMRSLEKFVGGRLYETDLRLLQRTI